LTDTPGRDVACCQIYRRCLWFKIDGELVLQLHDELVAEVRRDQAEQAANLIEQAMTAAFLKVFPNAPVNGLLKVKIVKKWGEAKG
jgi:DNA polymerase I-like protein with 3'-5' exonuclease and polymerase domains